MNFGGSEELLRASTNLCKANLCYGQLLIIGPEYLIVGEITCLVFTLGYLCLPGLVIPHLYCLLTPPTILLIIFFRFLHPYPGTRLSWKIITVIQILVRVNWIWDSGYLSVRRILRSHVRISYFLPISVCSNYRFGEFWISLNRCQITQKEMGLTTIYQGPTDFMPFKLSFQCSSETGVGSITPLSMGGA